MYMEKKHFNCKIMLQYSSITCQAKRCRGSRGIFVGWVVIPGFEYRPPPFLSKDDADTASIFEVNGRGVT